MLIYDKNMEKWLEDTIVTLPDRKAKTSRHINEGLHDHKKRVNKDKEESRRRSELFVDNDIILNNKYELEKLRIHDPVLPNFDENVADIAAKKMHQMKSEHLKLKLDEEMSKSARRADDFKPGKLRINPLDRIIDLMDQFIAQAHHKLINGELLKLKYKVFVKYKIGYVFGLLRILKQNQFRMYSSMHFYRFYTPKVEGTNYLTSMVDMSYFLNLYEKLTRLDDDILTLVRYLWQLNEKRLVEKAIEATKFPKRYKSTPGREVYWWDTLKVPSYKYRYQIGR
ncbi:uncharacterized protein LOC125231621 [Leguminivora glycinivorella]|uniref:uncharacterized protein LOC125231621 n=1 Tax=Leguminivora glycinivorella TaxID=1035111 RepID=UPI00200E2B02|nr:uncharacterized protein LOC125231621 [Leguminivora glycinivorella]